MKKFYLVQSTIQDFKYIVTRRWYHNFIGRPILTVSKCIAKDKLSAEKIFLMNGYDFGLLHTKIKRRHAQ